MAPMKEGGQMAGIIQPCLDCEKRHLACHQDCEEYAEYKRQYEEMQKAITPDAADKYIMNKVRQKQRKQL